MIEFLAEYWDFIREKKSYWAIPLLIMLALAGGLIVFAKGSAIAPFIYTLF